MSTISSLWNTSRRRRTHPTTPRFTSYNQPTGLLVHHRSSGKTRMAAGLSSPLFPCTGLVPTKKGPVTSHLALCKRNSLYSKLRRPGIRMTMQLTESGLTSVKRRELIRVFLGVTSLMLVNSFKVQAEGAGLPPEKKPEICDLDCEKELENMEMVTTESGLQYRDIRIGAGPSPPIGFQVAAHYVAMVSSGKVFDSSLEKGQPYIFRVGAGQVIRGLDEGILTMKVGGKRRLYIPGKLAFPKGLTSAPGRPRVAPNSPVIFDVSLEYVPGLEDDVE